MWEIPGEMNGIQKYRAYPVMEKDLSRRFWETADRMEWGYRIDTFK